MSNPQGPDSDQAEPPPRPLDYYGPGTDPSKRKITAGQIFIGSLCWVLSVAAAIGAGDATGSAPAGYIVLAAILALSSVYFRGRLGSRGFFPGVLIGAALTCLIPLGIVAVICGGHALTKG